MTERTTQPSPVIQGLWVGSALSTLERLSLASFMRHRHAYHLYVYDDLEVPKGVTLRDANEILPRQAVFKDRALESFANFSDIFRYRLLLERGGFWADMDTICLRPFDFPQDYVFAMERTQEGTEERIQYGPAWVCGGVIKAPAGCEIIQYLYEASLERAAGNYEWWELGPPLITAAVSRFGLSRFVEPAATFVPLDWWAWQNILSDDPVVQQEVMAALARPAHAVHLWNSMWTRAGLGKDAAYPSACFYEQLKRRYLSEEGARAA